MTEPRDHWRGVYADKPADAVSWRQVEASASLRLIEAAGLGPGNSLIDVGGGASPLAGDLLARGWTDLTVLDIAETGLDAARAGLGPRAADVEWVVADVTAWTPMRTYDLWHDRAVFHFLTEETQRARYRQALAASLRVGAFVIVGTFAPDGPERCSGLSVRRWSAPQLAEELGPAYTLRSAFDETHLTPWGAAQAFTWTLFERVR